MLVEVHQFFKGMDKIKAIIDRMGFGCRTVLTTYNYIENFLGSSKIDTIIKSSEAENCMICCSHIRALP
jgi:hypothetical protein